MKTAVSLPDELFAQAERLAKERGVSRSRLYAEALAEHVRRHDANSITAALNAIYPTDEPAAESTIAGAAHEILRQAEW